MVKKKKKKTPVDKLIIWSLEEVPLEILYFKYMYIYEISKFGLETDTNMIHDPTSAMQLTQ